MAELIVRAPAKINLHLGVGAPREDGFHPLETVYQAIGLHDDLTALTADDWSVGLEVATYVDPVAVPLNGGNIVDKAAAALADLHGVQVRGNVTIRKAIPVAGGMAGGSADAAAALVALDRLWGLETSDADLLRLAGELGSDVPFALLGGTALGTGRGERVEPLRDEGTWWWVVVPSDDGLSTPAVYRHFDRLFPDAPATPPAAGRVIAALAEGSVDELAAALYNDLQEPAVDLRPALGDLLARGQAEGALRGLLSGSGPTCLFLCESGDHAREVAGALQGAGHPVVLVANGPVAGAHLVEYA
jgi:4-diphosphocytidyl-2-C-methyl-D-erythritol kinase